MRYKEPYCLFKKRLESGRIIYYYSYYDPVGRRKQLSTGCRLKSEAKKYCLELYRRGSMEPLKDVTFREYTRDFFIYDKCRYIQGKLMRGYSYSRSYADLMRKQLENHLLPFFGDFYMNKISAAFIEEWMLYLQNKELSRISINHYFKQLRLIFSEAQRLDDIQEDPTKSVKNVVREIKERGIYSDLEIGKLSDASRIEEVWKGNYMHFVYNQVAIKTGMRIGEIQALQKGLIHRDHIEVCHSWDRKYGLKGTKTGKNRVIPINKELYQLLLPLMQKSENFVFSCDGGKQPIDHKAVYKWQKRALVNIGVSEEERKNRNLTFHSYRHYFNTLLVTQGLPEGVIQAITGHSDGKMTRHYSHVGLEELKKWVE